MPTSAFYVGHPELIGRHSREIPAHQIGMPRGGGIGFCGADPFAAASSGDAGGPHVPGDPITSDVVAARRAAFHSLPAP